MSRSIAAFFRKRRKLAWLSGALLLVVILTIGISSSFRATQNRRPSSDPSAGMEPMILSPARGPLPHLGDSSTEVMKALELKLPHVQRPRITKDSSTGESVFTFDIRPSTKQHPCNQIESIWEGALFAGAYISLDSGRWHDLGGFRVPVDAQNGARTIVGSRANVVADQRFLPVPDSLESSLRKRAKSFDLRSIQIKKINVIQDAIAIKSVTAAPLSAISKVRARGLARLLGGDMYRYEGVYFELADVHHRVVYAIYTAPRSASSGGCTAPELKDRTAVDN